MVTADSAASRATLACATELWASPAKPCAVSLAAAAAVTEAAAASADVSDAPAEAAAAVAAD
ncbi:hypothetical protein D3C72_1092630 [compost metagenome]